MNHGVICSRCSKKFMLGVTRVRRCIVFHFCEACTLDHRQECDHIMEVVSKPIAKGAVA